MMQISGLGLLNISTALFAADSLDSVVFPIASNKMVMRYVI